MSDLKGESAYRAVNTLLFGYTKTHLLMFYEVKVHTEQLNVM